MLASFDRLSSGIVRPVDPVARYRKPETLGHRPLRKRRRKSPLPLSNGKQSPEKQVDEYA